MEEKQDADVDDVDRESLVKEIELIRQTLGDALTRARSDHGASFDDQGTEESDDSEDELAIIKSPEYRKESADTYRAQDVPIEIISSESEDGEIFETRKKKRTLPTTVHAQDSHFSPQECVRQSQDDWEPLNNSAQCEQVLVTGAITGNTSDNQAPFSAKETASDYTLTELQPIKNSVRSLHENSESSFDQNVTIGPTEVVTEVGIPEEGALSAEEDSEELNEQQRCLKLNRKYQAIIEAQLKKIENLIIENREKQFALSQTSSLFSNEHVENIHLKSYGNPYFKVTRKEDVKSNSSMNAQDRFSVPDDNEDTKIRKSIGQPHPFATPPKAWLPQEKKNLCDAVKYEILQAKLMPLLQRIDDISKGTQTKDDEKELADLREQIDRLKSLQLSALVEGFTSLINFQGISEKVLSSRTPHQCQVMWYNELHPHLNKGKWTKEEDKLLLKFAEENDTGGSWEKIAHELKSNRSPVQCLRRFQKSLNKNFLKSKWGPEDDKKLVEAVKMCGVGPWEKVSSFLEGRTGAQCMHRYNKSLDPTVKRGKWDEEEDELLRKGVELYGFNWKAFKKILPRRTDSQVRERWQDVIDPGLSKDAWTNEEDGKLLKIVEEQGVGLRNWSEIAKHMPGRTDNRCRRRWFLLMKDDPKTKEYFRNKKIKQDKLVGNFSRRKADRPEIGPEDFQVSDLSENEENTDGPAAKDHTAVQVGATVKERATAVNDSGTDKYVAADEMHYTVKDRATAVKELATVKDHARAVKDRATVKDRARAVKDRATVKDRARAVKDRATVKDRTAVERAVGKTRATRATEVKSRAATKGSSEVKDSASVKDSVTVKDRAVVKSRANTVKDSAAIKDSASKSPTSASGNKKVKKKNRREKLKTSRANKRRQPSFKSSERLNVTSTDKVRAKTLRTTRVRTRNNKDSTPITTTEDTTKTKSSSNSAKKTFTQPNKKTQKPKLTAPNPSVVSQASSLPNAMPISLLTQFSVLLQAFHVDVSGVLNSVNKPRESTVPPSNTITSSAGEQTPVTTIAQTVAQRPKQTTNSGENVPVTESQVVTNGKSTEKSAYEKSQTSANTLAPSSPAISPTTCPEQVQKNNNMNTDSVSTVEGNENNVDVSNDTGHNVVTIDDNHKNNVSNGDVVINNARSIGQNRPVGFNLSFGTEKSSKVSDDNSNTLKSLNETVSNKGRDARNTNHKRKRDNTKDMDVISAKRLNSEGNKGDGETEEYLNEQTSVLLSDKRHGIAHDIVVLDESLSEEEVNSDGSLRRTSKRKLDQSGHTIQTRANKRSKKTGSERSLSSDTSTCNIERVETASRRYPKRSTRNQPDVNSNTLVGSTAGDSECTSTSNMSRNNSMSSRGVSSTGVEKSTCSNVRRVAINSDKPRVPAIPPLPPSATTLSAFRKLLLLRKDLQSQANRLNVNNHGMNDSDQPDSQTTSLVNPLADRLVLVSNMNQTSHEEFRNSVAYQQLLNRFKGLFLWPGFLSLVDPNLQKSNNNEDQSQTARTPKRQRRKYRRQTR